MNDSTNVSNVQDSQNPNPSDSTTQAVNGSSEPLANWIEIKDGKFICSECQNESQPETNTIEGTVVADLTQIQTDLEQFPTKVVYATCPVCGMEFVFKLMNGKLYLEPSDMEK